MRTVLFMTIGLSFLTIAVAGLTQESAPNNALDPTGAPKPGSLDSGFAPSVLRSGIVRFIFRQSDGKVVVAGQFVSVNGEPRPGIARLNPNGALDLSFNPGSGVKGQISAVALAGDGKVWIAGRFSSVNNVSRQNIARLNGNGSVDASFDAGSLFSSEVNAMAAQRDGKIVVAGWSSRGFVFVRVHPDGTLDNGFEANAWFGDDSNSTGPSSRSNPLSEFRNIQTVALQADGKILFSGFGTSGDGYRIGRLNQNGSLDTSFSPATGSNVASFAVQEDGKLLIRGHISVLNGAWINGVKRLNADGSLDGNFHLELDGSVSSLALLENGKILIGGPFLKVNGVPRQRIARLNADGSLDDTFDPRSGPNAEVLAIAPVGSDQMLIGGSFVDVDGTLHPGIARLTANGSFDTSFNALTAQYASVNAVATQPDGKIIIGGDFELVDGQFRKFMARLNTDGSVDRTFDPGTTVELPVRNIAIQSDGKTVFYPGIRFVENVARSQLGRLHSNGRLDTGLNPLPGSGSVYVYGMTKDRDGQIVIAGELAWPGSANYIARLNSDGDVTSTIPPGSQPARTARCIALSEDQKLLVGGVSVIRRFLADGTPDRSFIADVETGQLVLAVASARDGKVLVGGTFTSIDAVPSLYLARLSFDGSLDTGFDIGSGPNGSVNAIALQSDGNILIGGAFTSLNGIPRYGLARLFGGEPSVSAPKIRRQPQDQSVLVGKDVAFIVAASGTPTPSYQWRLNGLNIPGATSRVLSLVGVTQEQAGIYSVVISNSAGLIISAEATLSVVIDTPVPLGEALDNLDLVWTTGGSASWSGATGDAPDRVDAARSGRISDNRESWMETTITGPGSVKFWWRVSAGDYHDRLEFYVGGKSAGQIRGETPWKEELYSVPPGVQALRWQYVKDWTLNGGEDRGWVDQVRFMPEPPTQTVTTTRDSGPGSLRQAILNSNAQLGFQVIAFNIPGPGPHTIRPLSALPTITDPVVIDGYTQPGAKPNSEISSQNATIVIELDGSQAGVGASGLSLSAPNSTVRGLVINRFSGVGIAVTSAGDLVEGNFIGTDLSGKVALGNAGSGVFINGGFGLIGGSTPGSRNVISGNNGNGVYSRLGYGHIAGNFVGTDASGTQPLGNRFAGVGVDRAWSYSISSNVISGNEDTGIWISGPVGTNNFIQGNFIGTDVSRSKRLGNGLKSPGILLQASDASVSNNTIAFNHATGIHVLSGSRNQFRQNLISGNNGLGIDLGPAGPTPNDEKDADTGPNNLQNFPVVTSAQTGSSTVIQGTLHSTPNTACRIELYASASLDPSDYGEGERFLGAINTVTDSAGNGDFKAASTEIVPIGQFVTATATALSRYWGLNSPEATPGSQPGMQRKMIPGAPPNGDTSEFSRGIVVTRGVPAEDAPPTISPIVNHVLQNTVAVAVTFTVSDAETRTGALVLAASSSNPDLVPVGNIQFLPDSPGDQNRRAVITPVANRVGSTTLTFTVKDSSNQTASTRFTLTVLEPRTDKLPTISAIPDMIVNKNRKWTFFFSIADPETLPDSLIVTATSSNTLLVPNANIVLFRQGTTVRTDIEPALNQLGMATITIAVMDSAAQTISTSFKFSVVEPIGLELLVGTARGVKGSQVLVPIRVNKFTNLQTVSFSLHWNTNVAVFKGAEQLGLGDTLSVKGPTDIGTMVVFWFDPTRQGRTLSDGTTLFVLRFELVGAPGSSSGVNIDDKPNSMSAFTLVDGLARPVEVVPIAGEISISDSRVDRGPSLKILREEGRTGIRIPVTTIGGMNYALEYTESLPASNWQELSRVLGDGTEKTFTDPALVSAQRFYRVRIEPVQSNP